MIITRPAKGPDVTLALGVDDDASTRSSEVISNASCTTRLPRAGGQGLHDTVGIGAGW